MFSFFCFCSNGNFKSCVFFNPDMCKVSSMLLLQDCHFPGLSFGIILEPFIKRQPYHKKCRFPHGKQPTFPHVLTKFSMSTKEFLHFPMLEQANFPLGFPTVFSIMGFSYKRGYLIIKSADSETKKLEKIKYAKLTGVIEMVFTLELEMVVIIYHSSLLYGKFGLQT